MFRRSIFVLASLAIACGDDVASLQGKPCVGPADCAELDCLADPDTAAADLEGLPLACSSERQGRDPAEACERGEQCASGICVLAGACTRACEDGADCGSFERCQQVYARGKGERLHPVHACVTIVDLGDGASIDVETRANAFSGGSDVLDLPGTSEPTLFVIEHLDDDGWPVPSPATACRPALCAETLEPLDDPAAVWFDRQQLSAAEGPLNPVALGDHVHPLTVLVPAGPRSQPTAAGYQLVVESKRPGRARIISLAREPSGGRLHLNLFYAGTTVGSDAIARALDEVERIFEPAGVELGDRREIRIGGELLERGSDLPDAAASRGFARLRLQYRVYPQLPELLKLSAGAANRALDVFFVDAIDAGDAEVGGFAGSTPVPFGMHGTGASGVVIATGGLEARELGQRLAHELGHALGLFHTVETHGDVLDPLPDTAADESGETNLMFPVASASATALTQDQIEVIRRSMVLD